MLHKTHTPLHLWFWAAYLMSTPTPGRPAVQLQRQLGLSRYETAWTMLHKLRRAMANPQRAHLIEEVEVDECFVGGHEAGLRGGRARGEKALMAVGVEVRGKGSGRVRMTVIDDASAPTLTGFVRDTVAIGSTVHTDAWRGQGSPAISPAGGTTPTSSPVSTPLAGRVTASSRAVPRSRATARVARSRAARGTATASSRAVPKSRATATVARSRATASSRAAQAVSRATERRPSTRGRAPQLPAADCLLAVRRLTGLSDNCCPQEAFNP